MLTASREFGMFYSELVERATVEDINMLRALAIIEHEETKSAEHKRKAIAEGRDCVEVSDELPATLRAHMRNVENGTVNIIEP